MDKERDKSWGTDIIGLTEFEKKRKPRTPVTDDSTTTIQLRTLNVELTCPICLGILHNTMTVMECLHRFCASCINHSIQFGKKECPTCRVKCSSKRHLRPDPNFDGIINRIYPNLDEFEEKEETAIAEINKQIMSNNFVQNIEEGKRRQAEIARRLSNTFPSAKKRSNSLTDDREEDDEDESSYSNSQRKKGRPRKSQNETSPEKDEIGFMLLPNPSQPQCPELKSPYLRTSKSITIRHLKKFLSKKLEMEVSFKIALPDMEALSEDTTLDEIVKNLWEDQSTIKLYYSTSKQ
eukprot:TRINITY_DN8679_c0_g1_i1.p1 TRINITY_DN8679_c0_g1~~TRINITY_DN8679_c0_g1_i1.p1  ORF type:complete len:293 (+),score=54.93 TRINITY_DN8679_c0_g1_i1:90-968(+)